MIKSILLVDDESLFHLVFEDACSLLDIALNLESIDSSDKAEEMFKKAQKLVPSSAAAIAGMAYINFKKHQLESAIDLYNKAINLDQTNAELRRELGDAEWDGDPCAELIRTEFKHYEALLKQGVLYEPNF